MRSTPIFAMQDIATISSESDPYRRSFTMYHLTGPLGIGITDPKSGVKESPDGRIVGLRFGSARTVINRCIGS